ncbi:MAG TPA: regulatory iron-sulfur-containing complex subunit RicT [bacterium]|jgi:cell fate regulator YaaT (PSP1 superfamily)
MLDVLEIEFKGRRKEYALNPMQFPFLVGDIAIVEVERGHDMGKVSHLGWRAGMESDETPTISVIRKAAIADCKVLDQNAQREQEARGIARQKITDHHLDMKLVDVELQWDGRKMTFYFTAEGRVDFRELVKDLASTFRTRIDLRQIGARDETKRAGGYGVCGRQLCCSTFLNEFKPITTQMPRDQFLPLNPSKLSGVCGRLKCCLRYELDVYRDFQRSCPKVGHPVRDEVKGDGVIEKLDVVREQIQVRYGSGDTEKFSQEEFVQITNWKPEMPKNECICTCGRKPAAPQAAPVTTVEEHSIPGVQVRSGEKVSLLAGGGLGMQSGTKGEEIQVGTDLNVPAKAAQPKKKRKRRRHKKPGDPNATAKGGEDKPGQDEPESEGDDE